MRECTFNVLTPGRRYVITVATRSRNLSSSVSVEGRTGVFSMEALLQTLFVLLVSCPTLSCTRYMYVAVPMALRSLTLTSSGVTSLQASWEKPPGDVDSYTLALLLGRCVQAEITDLVLFYCASVILSPPPVPNNHHLPRGHKMDVIGSEDHYRRKVICWIYLANVSMELMLAYILTQFAQC